MRSMVEAGHSAVAIAVALGSTPGSVRVKCSEMRISFKKVFGAQPPPPPPVPLPPPERPQEFSVSVSKDDFALLKAAADKRQISPRRLARRLLRAILRDNMIEAVLDDD
jgi:hypothetical protein